MITIRLLLMVAFGWLAVPTAALAFYNPSAGRWLNRDPIAEKGGVNVNAFVDNTPVNVIDADGRLMTERCHLLFVRFFFGF